MVLAVYEDGDYAEGIAVMLFIRSANGSSPMPSGAAAAIFPTSWISDQIGGKTSCRQTAERKKSGPDMSAMISLSWLPAKSANRWRDYRTSSLNTVALTGESLPRSVKQGDAVISGCINTSGLLHIRTTKAFAESTALRKSWKLVEYGFTQIKVGELHC